MNQQEQAEKALKILEQQYQTFIDQQDKWDFFRGLAEYTKTVQEMTQTKPFIEALEAQRKMALQTYEIMNNEATKELAKSAERLTSIAQDMLKQYEPLAKQAQDIYKTYQPIARAVQEVQERMAGQIISSHPLRALNSDLFDVARFVKASGHEKAVKEFEDNKRETKNIYGNYTFSPTYEKIFEEEQKVERKEQVEPWGAWQKLPLIEKIIFEPEIIEAELKEEAKGNPPLRMNWLNFIGVAGEMEKIRKGEGSDNDIVFFRVKDFRNYAQRVHNYITAELLKADKPETSLGFDDEKRLLYFMGETIVIGKKEESDPHKLMRTLFNDTTKVWANDEILEDWGYSFDEKVSKNKVYQAGKVINQVVAQDTKIKDFLVISTKSVSINKKYLNP